MAMMARPAIRSRPAVKLPVASFIQPIAYGPAKPARLPIELITAMPAAAALPDKTAVGSVQNTGSVPNTPQAPMVNATIVKVGLPVSVDAAMPADATNDPVAVCPLGSPVGSDW